MLSKRQHQAIIALGSNLNDPIKQCQQAMKQLAQLAHTTLLAASSLYETAPLTLPEQKGLNLPRYINAVIHLQTSMNATELFQEMLSIELSMGRMRTQKWGPRTIDLDLLFFDDEILNEPDLTIPHPEIQHRAFVLTPLAEILPQWIHPILKLPINLLAKKISDPTIQRLPIKTFSALRDKWD